jgi:protein-disulfide isomerase
MQADGQGAGQPGTCDNPVAKVRELGTKLNVTATATIFFPSGKRLRG